MLDFIIKYWLEILFTVVTSGFVYIFKQYVSLKNGMRILLWNEIVRIYETYTNLGYCPSYMKENVNKMYECYHTFKGNGMATSMIEEIYKLPIDKSGDKNDVEII